MKFLIAGLGNPGEEYACTRHNVGFQILDKLVTKEGLTFENARHAFITSYKLRGRILILIKPTTFMNLSGKAVNYWLQHERVPIDNLLIVTDDVALPFGALRMRNRGGGGGHNGLTDIMETLDTQKFARLRFGIGEEYEKGGKVDYVLGQWTREEESQMDNRIKASIQMIEGFCTIGVERTMSAFNNK